MSSTRASQPRPKSPQRVQAPQSAQTAAPDGALEPDPAGQSPDAPIEFTSDDDVARGNAERANAEPEPVALHDAKVPGVPDAAAARRREAAEREEIEKREP